MIGYIAIILLGLTAKMSAGYEVSAKKSHNAYFWAGLALYALSFFLFAVSDAGIPAGRPTRGYSCAYLASLSWLNMREMEQGHGFADDRFAFICLLAAGLINPMFLFYSVSPIPILRRVLLFTIPLCWLFLYFEGLIPREGHVLWVLGMLLVLFSDKLSPKEPAAVVVRPPT